MSAATCQSTRPGKQWPRISPLCPAASLTPRRIIGGMDEFEFLSPDSFRIVRWIEATLEDVWDYLTRPELREAWLAGGTIDLQPGGQVELHFDFDEADGRQEAEAAVYGAVRQIAPLRWLEFDWTDVPPGGSRENAHYPDSVVRFALDADGDQVRLEVIHAGLPAALLATGATGWHVHLNVLATLLGGELPEPFAEQFVAAMPQFQARFAASGLDIS